MVEGINLSDPQLKRGLPFEPTHIGFRDPFTHETVCFCAYDCSHRRALPSHSNQRLTLVPKLYLRFSDLFDREPTSTELIELLKDIPGCHAIYTPTSLNQCLRVVMQDRVQDLGKLREKLLATHMDDECLSVIKSRCPMSAAVSSFLSLC